MAVLRAADNQHGAARTPRCANRWQTCLSGTRDGGNDVNGPTAEVASANQVSPWTARKVGVAELRPSRRSRTPSNPHRRPAARYRFFASQRQYRRSSAEEYARCRAEGYAYRRQAWVSSG